MEFFIHLEFNDGVIKKYYSKINVEIATSYLVVLARNT